MKFKFIFNKKFTHTPYVRYILLDDLKQHLNKINYEDIFNHNIIFSQQKTKLSFKNLNFHVFGCLNWIFFFQNLLFPVPNISLQLL